MVPQVGECRAHPMFVGRRENEWCREHVERAADPVKPD
jgi:hypothetical protein